MDSLEALKIISRHRGEAVVVTCMTTNFEWPQVSTRPDFDLFMSGAMGKESSVGLGVALARPDRKVMVLSGDGSLLMNLGSLVTISHQAPPNLYHFVFQNNVYRTSGGQPIPGAGKFDFAALAKASGYPNSHDFDELETFELGLRDILTRPGPALMCLHVPPATERPPFPMTRTVDILARFKDGLAKAGRD